MYVVTDVEMNGLNRYLYVYNAPSIGMEVKIEITDDMLIECKGCGCRRYSCMNSQHKCCCQPEELR